MSRFDEPSWFHVWFLLFAAAIRKAILLHLLPPRPGRIAFRFVSGDDKPGPATEKYHAQQYRGHPWYVKPTFWNRWGPGALLTRLRCGGVPGDPAYYPGGYLSSELGPESFREKGDAEME